MNKQTIYEKTITVKNTLGFALPTVIRLIFISLYSIVDGIVVANFVGSLGLAAINIVYPVLNVNMAIAFMFATGSNALVGKLLGEGKKEEANSFMTLTIFLNVVASLTFIAVFFLYQEKIYYFLGADETLIPYCMEYGIIMVLIGPVWALQILFQSFLVTSDRPNVSLGLSIAGGVINVVLDVLFVGVFHMGLRGAGLATACGIFIGGIVPLFLFSNRNSLLHFRKPRWFGKGVRKALSNGLSEMVVSISSAITTALFNIQTMRLAGEKGVAAISVILYLIFLFTSTIIGFSSGVGPLISYNYGSGNRENIRRVSEISFKTMIACSFLLTAVAEVFTKDVTFIFASEDPILSDYILKGFRIVALGILFGGINIFSSGFFTALQNGKISAGISFLRTFVFQIIALILLPILWGLNGVWWALPISEILAFLVSISFLIKCRKKYGY